MMQAREIRQSDGDAIIEIHRKSIRGLCKNNYSNKQIAIWTNLLTREMFDAGIADKENIGIVVIEDNELIGYGFMNMVEPRYKRQGALQLFAGLSVADGYKYGQTADRKRFIDFQAFLMQTILPEAVRRKVHTLFLILDNGSTITPPNAWSLGFTNKLDSRDEL